MHPIFGDIKDSAPAKPSMKMHADFKAQMKSGSKKTFTTSALQMDYKVKDTKRDTAPSVQKVHITSDSALKKPCIFCKGEHSLESCRKIRSKPHTEKIDFLRAKRLCFGCLKHGHMSKGCKEKLCCQKCSLMHPTLLHIKKQDGTGEQEDKNDDNVDGHSVTSALVCAGNKTCGVTGAGEECILSVVPVQVKATKGSKTLETYAFLDPGSTDCFCTETLMNQLKVTGRRTSILLRAMGDEKPVAAYEVSGLEVSSLAENKP